MKNRNIADTLWEDPGFLSLPPQARMVWIYLLTCPALNLIGVFAIGPETISAHTGLSAKEVDKAMCELAAVSGGMAVKSAGRYVIICNYAKYNTYAGELTLKGVRRAFDSLPDEVWLDAMRFERIRDLYERSISGEKTAEENRREAMFANRRTEMAAEEAQPLEPRHNTKTTPKTPQKQPRESKQPNLDIIMLRGQVTEILRDYPGCRNGRNDITNEQYEILLRNYGRDLLIIAQRIYFKWKFAKVDKQKYTDFGTLNGGWPIKEAKNQQAEMQQISPNSATRQEKDKAMDRYFSSNRDEIDSRIGKRWRDLSESEIETMIKNRRYE